MKFIKVHQNGRKVLVNLDNVSDIYEATSYRSMLYFNSEANGDQVTLTVDESLNEILELIKQVS